MDPRARAHFLRPWGGMFSLRNLWVALVVGGGLRLAAPGPGNHLLSVGIVPYAMTIVGLTMLLMLRQPKVEWVLKVLRLLTFGRWFWLGYLVVAAWMLSQDHTVGIKLTTYEFFFHHLAGCSLAFIALHCASRAPKKVDVKRFQGHRRQLVIACDRYSRLVIFETMAVLVAVVIVSFEHPSTTTLKCLSLYAITSAVGAQLMKWTLEGYLVWGRNSEARYWGALCRVLTVVAAFWIPLLVASGLYPAITNLSLLVWIFPLCLGLLGGKPWFSNWVDRL